MRAVPIVIGVMVMLTAAGSTWGADFPISVAGLNVQGNEKISSEEILKAVDEVFEFQSGKEITAEELKAASQAIFDLGWFSEVMPKIEGEMITFQVKENPVLEEIKVTGNVNEEPFKFLGVTILSPKIMPTGKIRRILRDHDVKKGKLINNRSLEEGLTAVIEEYDEKGYALIRVGEVTLGEVLEIQVIEGRVTENVIKGLVSIPVERAEEMIDIPEDKCLKKDRIQRTLEQLNSSVYFSEVDITPQQGPTTDSIRLVWTLTENRLIDSPLEIDKIELAGITQFESEVAEASLGKLPAGPIDNYRLLQIVAGLYDLYYRNGYTMVRFSASPRQDRRLCLDVMEGKIGEIVLQGNKKTKDYVILKNLEVKAGDVLNRQRLAVNYQGLMALEYFESIDFFPEWTDGTIRLSVSVAERKKLGGLGGSLAYSPDSGGLVGKLDYSQKNLFGTGQDLTLSYNRGLIGDKSSKWDIGYETVAFFPGLDRVGLNVYRESDEQALSEGETQKFLTIGTQASVSYPWADYTDLVLSYKHERVSSGEVVEFINSATVALRFDDVSNPYFPTAGSRRSVSFEKAGEFAPGVEFSKLNASWINFSSLRLPLPGLAGLDQVWAVRLVMGWGEDLSPSQAYSLGGPGTIRCTEPVAVRRLAYMNMEYRLAVVEGLTTSLFLDSGVSLDRVNADWTKSSVGIELGVRVAGTYVRLDMGWALGPEMDLVPSFDFGFSPMF
jgi:outer membrane protein insertion porin family